MKRIVTLLLILMTGIEFSVAQEGQPTPTVMKAVYFDISPPLRDMVQRSDAKADNSWKEGIVKNKLNVVSPEGDQQDPTAADAVRQFTFGDAVTDTTLQNFDGVGANGSWPPDTDGDVGPSHYFQVVNVKFAIYNKNGVKLMGPSNNSTIFN